MQCTAAVAQCDARVGDCAHNLQQHLALIDKAAAAGADIILFPELSLTGYTLRDLVWDVAMPVDDPLLEVLRERSRTISIIFGMVESAPNHGVYNAAVFMEDGVVKHVHRKIYPPTYGMFEEGRYFSPGGDVRAFDSKHGRFGILICEDIWHIALPYLLACDGAEAIFCLSASPTRLGGEQTDSNASVNHEHHRTFARLLSCYVLFSNRIGFEDGVNFWGGSLIAAPSGEAAAAGDSATEGIISAGLSSEEVRRARRFSRHAIDDRPDLVAETLRRIMK